MMINTHYAPLHIDILYHLTGKEITRLQMVCKAWREYIQLDATALALIQQNFPKYTIRPGIPLHQQLNRLHCISYNINHGIFSISKVEINRQIATLRHFKTANYSITRNTSTTLTISKQDKDTVIDCMGYFIPHNSLSPPIVHDIQVTSDETRVVTGAFEIVLRVWDLETGTLLHTLEGHEHRIFAVRIRSQDQRALSIDEKGHVICWDLETGQRTQETHTGYEKISGFELTPDQNRLCITSCIQTKVKILDLTNWMQNEIECGAHLSAFVFTSDQQFMITIKNGRYNGSLLVFDLNSPPSSLKKALNCS